MTTALRRCVAVLALFLAVLILDGMPSGIFLLTNDVFRKPAEASQDEKTTVLEVAQVNVEGSVRPIPSTKKAIKDRIEEIQTELDALLEKKESLLKNEEIAEEDLRRMFVAVGVLQNVYSRLTSAYDNLAEAKRDEEAQSKKAAAPLINGQPPFNLSFYEDVRNRYEAVEQRLEAVHSSIRLAEGTISTLQEKIQRMEEEHRVLFEELQTLQNGSGEKKLLQVKEAETDLEATKASLVVQDINSKAQIINRNLLVAERDNLKTGVEFVKKHLAYDEKDRTDRIERIGEQIAAANEKLPGLREERERARTALTKSQGALTSARNEKERLFAQVSVAEQQAALLLAEVSLEHTEQTLRFLEEEQRIWNARYSLLNGSLKGQELWDMRSLILSRVKDLESAFLVRQRDISSIQETILAAQKELEEHAGVNTVLARIRSRVDLLNRIVESTNASVTQVFSLFNQYNRLREEINEHIDAVKIAERVTTFGKERFFAFWNITLWSGDGYDITVAKLVIAVLLFLAAFFLSGRLTDFLSRTLFNRFGMDSTAMMASRKILFFVLMGAFILAALDLVGIPLTAFAFLGGALAIGIGFGAQNIFNNLISGFILMFSEPMRVDDTIEIDGLFASVQEIGTRATRVKTFDNIDVLMPNSYFLNNKIVNWTLTDQKIRLKINVGVEYGSDARKVEELLLLAANDHTRVLRNPEPFVIFREFGPSALEFSLFFWIDMTNASTLKVPSDLRYRLTALFTKNRIKMAFPQMDVHLDTRSPIDLCPSLPSDDADRTHTQEVQHFMLSLAEKDLYSLLLDLVAIPSVSFSEEENRAADFIFSTLSDLEYFRRHPSFLRFLPVEGDPLERKAVAALVKAKPETKRTVIITGHFDVVDAEACGHLKHLAFSPEEYTRRVDELEIPEEARADLASGEYLFGRGVSDMKSGIALEMCLIGALSRSESFPANVLFLAVPDEENTSAGMRGAVPWLVRLRDEWELEYAACLNSEPSVGGRGIPAGGVYVGTIGKIMPFYLCVGKEAHVGDYYEGVSASLLTSYLSLILEGSPETAESLNGVHFPPQACLRFKDLVKNYSVTLPERSVAYYNCLTVSRTPARILEEMKAAAGRALEMTLDHLSKARQTLRERGAPILEKKALLPRVLSYSELLEKVRSRTDHFDDVLESFLKTLPDSMDERDLCIETASFLLDLSGEKGPLILVGFLPPFYPPRLNRSESNGERALLRAVERLKEAGKPFGLSISRIDVFQGIMDLSYLGFQGEPSELDALAENMPLWGRGYRFPLDELKKLDVPIANFGPIGKDDHKNAERIFLPYYLHTLPPLFFKFVEFLAEEY